MYSKISPYVVLIQCHTSKFIIPHIKTSFINVHVHVMMMMTLKTEGNADNAFSRIAIYMKGLHFPDSLNSYNYN